MSLCKLLIHLFSNQILPFSRILWVTSLTWHLNLSPKISVAINIRSKVSSTTFYMGLIRPCSKAIKRTRSKSLKMTLQESTSKRQCLTILNSMSAKSRSSTRLRLIWIKRDKSGRLLKWLTKTFWREIKRLLRNNSKGGHNKWKRLSR